MVFSNGKSSITMKELSNLAGDNFHKCIKKDFEDFQDSQLKKELEDLETETENRNYPFFNEKSQKADLTNFKADFEKYEKKYLESQKKLKKV